MSDPVSESAAESVLKALVVLGGGAVSGVGAAMGWFRSHRLTLENAMRAEQTRVNDELLLIRKDIHTYYESQSEHHSDILVLKTQHKNTEDRLQDIFEATRDTNQKLDALILTLNQRRS